MTPAEVLKRVMLARTPTIATEDALTVAKLHDLVIAWTLAKQAFARHPHGPERSLGVASWATRSLVGAGLELPSYVVARIPLQR
jgi:hypothetical protein